MCEIVDLTFGPGRLILRAAGSADYRDSAQEVNTTLWPAPEIDRRVETARKSRAARLDDEHEAKHSAASRPLTMTSSWCTTHR